MDSTKDIYHNEGTSDTPTGNINISIGLTPINDRMKGHIFDDN